MLINPQNPLGDVYTPLSLQEYLVFAKKYVFHPVTCRQEVRNGSNLPKITHPAFQGSIKTTKWRRRGPILTICLPISCPASSHTDTDLGTRAQLCGFPTPGSRSALSQDLFPGYLSCRAWELSWVPARNRLTTVASGVLQ